MCTEDKEDFDMNKEKTVQEHIDYGKESTRLLKKYKVEFLLYDTGFPGKIGIVVNNKDMDTAMQRRITEAGYTYAGAYPKKHDCSFFTIDAEKLMEILENL